MARKTDIGQPLGAAAAIEQPTHSTNNSYLNAYIASRLWTYALYI